MSMTELEQAETRLAGYYEAESKILNSQSYKSGSRAMVYAELAEIRKGIVDLETKVARLKNGGGKAFRVVPRDL